MTITKNRKVYVLTEVLHYYAVQGKALSIAEIARYITIQTTQDELIVILDQLVQDEIVICFMDRYTLKGYAPIFELTQIRQVESIRKHLLLKRYIRFLSWFQTVEMICLTGSCSIQNAKLTDDIDLMIVTSARRLYTTRFVIMIYGWLWGIVRLRRGTDVRDKLCINLWLSIDDMSVPAEKQTLYSARECAQMSVYYERSPDIRKEFDRQNTWIVRFLPQYVIDAKSINTYINISKDNKIYQKCIDITEKVMQLLQKKYMQSHITRECITDTQLWFHPHDRSSDRSHHLRQGEV